VSEDIKKCDYKDLRYIGMRWLCRCCSCNELFLGIKSDFICSCCESKPEIKNGDE
jgi:hypothetical protein